MLLSRKQKLLSMLDSNNQQGIRSRLASQSYRKEYLSNIPCRPLGLYLGCKNQLDKAKAPKECFLSNSYRLYKDLLVKTQLGKDTLHLYLPLLYIGSRLRSYLQMMKSCLKRPVHRNIYDLRKANRPWMRPILYLVNKFPEGN